MFHLLEVRQASFDELVEWMRGTPIYCTVARRAGFDDAGATAWAVSHLRRLVDDGVLLQHGEQVAVRPQAH
jgi:hypothetical protein